MMESKKIKFVVLRRDSRDIEDELNDLYTQGYRMVHCTLENHGYNGGWSVSFTGIFELQEEGE